MTKVSEMLKTRRVDPRGDINEFDPDRMYLYVDKFRTALSADVEEDQRADLVCKVHKEICSDYALYIAVCDNLGPSSKRAIRTYVEMVSKRGNPAYSHTDGFPSG
jgi:hypothetical protein